MPASLLPLLLLAGAVHAQATSDGATGRTGTGAALGFAAVRPLPDPSQACRHGANGLPGVPVPPATPGSGSPSEAVPPCPGGTGQPTMAGQPADPPPFTGGVFGPGGRGPDKRPPS